MHRVTDGIARGLRSQTEVPCRSHAVPTSSVRSLFLRCTAKSLISNILVLASWNASWITPCGCHGGCIYHGSTVRSCSRWEHMYGPRAHAPRPESRPRRLTYSSQLYHLLAYYVLFIGRCKMVRTGHSCNRLNVVLICLYLKVTAVMRLRRVY